MASTTTDKAASKANTATIANTTPDTDDIKLRCHAAFNRRVFRMDIDGNLLDSAAENSEKKRASSNELTHQEWLDNIDICRQWDQEDDTKSILLCLILNWLKILYRLQMDLGEV